EIFRKRERGAVQAFDLRVGRLDDVVFIRGMCATAVAQAEMAGRQAEGRAGEHEAGPGPGVARPEQRLNTMTAVNGGLSLDESRVSGRAGGIITASHVDLDIAVTTFGQVPLQGGQG